MCYTIKKNYNKCGFEKFVQNDGQSNINKKSEITLS